jgi:hypothetical protein
MIKKLIFNRYFLILAILVTIFNYEIRTFFIKPKIEETIEKFGILESDFNKSVILKTIPEIIQNIGKPDSFQVRDNFFVLDYANKIIIENSKNLKKDDPLRYSLVRLLVHRQVRNIPLGKNGIFFKK